MWPTSKAPAEHRHDPISLELIQNWFGILPLEETIVAEDRGTERWMGVYGKSDFKAHSEYPQQIIAPELSL